MDTIIDTVIDEGNGRELRIIRRANGTVGYEYVEQADLQGNTGVFVLMLDENGKITCIDDENSKEVEPIQVFKNQIAVSFKYGILLGGWTKAKKLWNRYF